MTTEQEIKSTVERQLGMYRENRNSYYKFNLYI